MGRRPGRRHLRIRRILGHEAVGTVTEVGDAVKGFSVGDRVLVPAITKCTGESWCAQVRQEAGLELSKSTFSHHLRIMREAGLVTKRIQGARGYARLRKDDVDRRFPGLLDSVINADDPALV